MVPPRYVVIERLRRERRCCGLLRTGTVTLTYSRAAAADVEVRLGQLMHPSDAHLRLAQWYEALLGGDERMMRHREAIHHMEDAASLEPAWRDALTPFCRGFEPHKLALGWHLNYLLLVALLALLVMDFITLHDSLPFGEIGLTLLYGFLAEPMLAALFVLIEIVQIFFALMVLRKLLAYTGLDSKLVQLFDRLSARRVSISARFSQNGATLRSSAWDEGGALDGRSSGVERLSRRASSTSFYDEAAEQPGVPTGASEQRDVAAVTRGGSIKRGGSLLRRGYSFHADEDDDEEHAGAGSIELSTSSIDSSSSPRDCDPVLGGGGAGRAGSKGRSSVRKGSFHTLEEDGADGDTSLRL